MVAADSSAWIDFWRGTQTIAAARLEYFLGLGGVVVPPVVVSEVLSGSDPDLDVVKRFLALETIPVRPGYWGRAGRMRKSLLQKKRRASTVDCLIAQSCIDDEIGLVTSDRDFESFREFGLLLIE